MGAVFCCQNKGPCDSPEETSGLLQNDLKSVVPTGEAPAGGNNGPGINDDLSKEQTNMENESEPCSTQENGTLQKECLQTATLSSSKTPQHKANSAEAQDVDIGAAASEDAGHEYSALNTQQKGHALADWEVSKTTSPLEEEKSAPGEEEKCLNETPAAVCAENTPLTEASPKQEQITMNSINNNNEEVGDGQGLLDKSVDKASTETCEDKEGVQLPNTKPAAPVCQVLPISQINQEVNNAETSNCVDKNNPEHPSSPVSVEANLEETQSHDVPECSPGPASTGFDHSSVDGEPVTTAPADVCESSDQVKKKDTTLETTVENIQPEVQVKDDVCEEKQEDTLKEEEGASMEAEAEAGDAAMNKKEQHLAESKATEVGVEPVAGVEPVTTWEESMEEDLENSEEDLYRGAEELSASQTSASRPPSLSETSLLKLEDRCSLAPPVDILSYSEREWKGNTAKSALIRKGYKEMSQRFSSLRRVRGDNYCALRATLYQVLCHTTQMPVWLQEENVTMLPKQLEAQEGLISHWVFPGECLQEDGTGDATQQLKGYMELLQNKWQAAVDCLSAAERQQLCEHVFQGGEEELGLLEALKLLMLARAVELHSSMQSGGDIPLFCWLLFARDSSDCPRSFLANHLSHVGLSAGLEQVEMFLLGYALQCTIEVYRLYKADTEEFITFYPDDHKDIWPSVCLVTEDDRHYNVPVLEAADHPKELKSS